METNNAPQVSEEENELKKRREKKMTKIRKCTVNRHILKVVGEAIDLKRDMKKFRYVKHEMRPPLTSTYIHFDALRQVHNLQRSLQYDVAQLAKNDDERIKELEDVKSTCESYKRIMLNFTNFIDQNREKRERTVKQMDENIKIIKDASVEIRRLIKAAQDLLYVRDTMQKVIDENTRYVEFLNDVVSKSDRYKSIEVLVNRHETLISTKNRLIDRYLQLITEIELAKLESLKDNYNNVMAMVSALGKLQQVDYALMTIQNESKTMSEMGVPAETEEAPKTASAITSLLINPVATFTSRLADKLISAGMADKSLHQKTLPQQVEAIRSEYFRKLDIIRNYRENLEAKHRRREKRAFIEKRKEESKQAYEKKFNHLLDRVKVLNTHEKIKQKKLAQKRKGRRPTLLSEESTIDSGTASERKSDDDKEIRRLDESSVMDDLVFDRASVASVCLSSDDTDSVSASGDSFSSTITRTG